MRYPKREHPGRASAGVLITQTNGRGLQNKYNPNAAPASFWRGFAGTESMAPPIHRRPAKPRAAFWNPGGAA